MIAAEPSEQEQATALAARLERIEGRLTAALAAGTRGLPSWHDELRAEADELERPGLAVLAARLRALVDAREPLPALGALTLALRTSEQLRLRLASDVLPGEGWTALRPVRETRAADRLVPVARVTVGGEALWACARLRGRFPEALVLLEPLAVPAGVQPWLAGSHLLAGRLRWQERRALGAGTLDRFALDEPAWEPSRDAKEDPLGPSRAQLASGKVADGTVIAHAAWPLHLVTLKTDARDTYVWLDPSLEAALLRPPAFARGTWAISWSLGAQEAPLALLAPHGLLRKELHLIHPDGARDRFPT